MCKKYYANNNMDEIKYWIWFSRMKKITNKQKIELLEVFQTPQNLWNIQEYSECEKNKIDKSCLKELLNVNYRNNLDKYIEYIIKNNIQIITIFDDIYPEKLKNIYDSPIILFAKGNVNLLKTNGISVVGCRDCSIYGKNVARKLSYDLAKQNITIISGLAKGIDACAHLGALDAGGGTIAVVGNGLDYIYPYENKRIYERIIENKGLIITEYIIGTKPEKMNFPARNRIISGLSDGVIVVEAKEKSGSLITVDFALEQGKNVYAVPGNINSLNSYGTNELIKQGAFVITDITDIAL